MPHIPEWIESQVTKLGGHVNGEPLYRLIWGADRRELMGDAIINPYVSADGTTVSNGFTRWHLEKLHEGTYEHVYKFGYCPHVTAAKPKWCNSCTLSGGEYLDVTTSFAVIERVMTLFIKTEQYQNEVRLSVAAAAERKESLDGRERAKETEANTQIHEAVHDAAPITVPRSYNPSFRRTADKTLGRSKMRQLKHEEIN